MWEGEGGEFTLFTQNTEHFIAIPETQLKRDVFLSLKSMKNAKNLSFLRLRLRNRVVLYLQCPKPRSKERT